LNLPSRWANQLLLLAVWLVAALLIGAWFGQVAWVLVGALIIYLARVLINLYQLDRAITSGKRFTTVSIYGLWAELHAKVFKLREKSRGRKRRYVRLLREVRESTGAISDAGVILNSLFEITWFNRAATRLLGLSAETDIGHRIDNLIRYPEFVEFLHGKHDEPLVVPSPVFEAGTISIQLIPYGQEQTILIARDVTHEVQLARTRRDFVANASHELRSPLTVIGGYLDALAYDEEVPKAWRAPIDEMLRQIQRMTQILRDLIELTRLESADEPAGRDFVSAKDILSRIVQEYRGRKNVPSIQLELNSDAGLLGSETEVYSIFYNIISNAARFTPVNGTVFATWDSTPQGATFSVRDTGIGIAPELIPRLTERFYRVDPGRSRASGGTGLGLAIVKHALQRHEGVLEISSVEGEGSTFTCIFPRSRVVEREGTNAAIL
jgi:two-component system phosphate regulon sensor histidine kinase PhoR